MANRVISVGAMRAWEEATWATGVSPEAVIKRAGEAVAAVARRLTGRGSPVLVLCGKGHNGDDANVAAGVLADRAVLCGRLEAPSSFAAARSWLAAHRNSREALIIDGLFGIGLDRPLSGPWAELVEAVKVSGVRVLSVDVPSGLDADTGLAKGGGPVVEATVTLTLGAVKRGLLASGAARYVGRLELADDLGLVAPGAGGGGDGEGLFWTAAADFAGLPPRRRDDGHKGTFGHVAIVAGSVGYHGAAVLAAQGALRARPGLVTVYTDEGCYVPVASQLRAAMVRPWRGEEIAERYDAIVMGPGLASRGLSPAVATEVRRLWRKAEAVVVADATALEFLRTIEGVDVARPRVVTPHPGEAARLLDLSVETVQGDRAGVVRRLAGRWVGASTVAVLKGRHSLVGRLGGPVLVNSTGNPGLGQGGTGDVLAGYLGGLLAQAGWREDPLLAVRYGVWRHGGAADALEASGRAWTVEDLVFRLA